MGYPGKNHKRYEKPKRRFEKSRIEDESKKIVEYGLRNKRELWKAESNMRRYRRAARDLLALVSASIDEAMIQRKKEELLGHLYRYGLLGENASIDEVLAMKVENELERRLQTLVYRQGLARSPKQARQFITHGHISVKGRKVTIPSYRISREEEPHLAYYGRSPFINEIHPERGRISKAGGR
jgi:small subunit ribosomal protein S4